MTRCVVGLGSSLGPRWASLELGVRGICAHKGARLLRCSRVYESPPMGRAARGTFLNAAILMEWSEGPRDLLAHLKEVEGRLGRQRATRWGDRVFDADILWMEGLCLEEDDLRIPHPGLRERNFALWPFLDLLPNAFKEAGVTTGQRLGQMRAPAAIGVLAG
jgi:2-amino-4-hydroxy-6-hydroxymethyldihydropteridine diphosphokinase